MDTRNQKSTTRFLAEEAANHGSGGRPAEILIFEVGGQRHGLPSSCIQELLSMVAITPLPQAPAHVEGIMNLRGRIVPILETRSRFQLPSKPAEPTDHLIVARTENCLVALRVDRATDLVQLDPASLEEAYGAGLATQNTAWVAKLPSGLVPIHDLSLFLPASDAAAVTHALPAPHSSGEEARA